MDIVKDSIDYTKSREALDAYMAIDPRTYVGAAEVDFVGLARRCEAGPGLTPEEQYRTAWLYGEAAIQRTLLQELDDAAPYYEHADTLMKQLWDNKSLDVELRAKAIVAQAGLHLYKGVAEGNGPYITRKTFDHQESHVQALFALIEDGKERTHTAQVLTALAILSDGAYGADALYIMAPARASEHEYGWHMFVLTPQFASRIVRIADDPGAGYFPTIYPHEYAATQGFSYNLAVTYYAATKGQDNAKNTIPASMTHAILLGLNRKFSNRQHGVMKGVGKSLINIISQQVQKPRQPESAPIDPLEHYPDESRWYLSNKPSVRWAGDPRELDKIIGQLKGKVERNELDPHSILMMAWMQLERAQLTKLKGDFIGAQRTFEVAVRAASAANNPTLAFQADLAEMNVDVLRAVTLNSEAEVREAAAHFTRQLANAAASMLEYYQGFEDKTTPAAKEVNWQLQMITTCLLMNVHDPENFIATLASPRQAALQTQHPHRQDVIVYTLGINGDGKYGFNPDNGIRLVERETRSTLASVAVVHPAILKQHGGANFQVLQALINEVLDTTPRTDAVNRVLSALNKRIWPVEKVNSKKKKKK